MRAASLLRTISLASQDQSEISHNPILRLSHSDRTCGAASKIPSTARQRAHAQPHENGDSNGKSTLWRGWVGYKYRNKIASASSRSAPVNQLNPQPNFGQFSWRLCVRQQCKAAQARCRDEQSFGIRDSGLVMLNRIVWEERNAVRGVENKRWFDCDDQGIQMTRASLAWMALTRCRASFNGQKPGLGDTHCSFT